MLLLSSLCGAIVLLPGCLSLISAVYAPSEIALDQPFAVYVDGGVVGHGGGVAALVVQVPEHVELLSAQYVGSNVHRGLRKHAALAKRYAAEEGHSVVVLADSLPGSRSNDADLRVQLRFVARAVGSFTLKFMTGASDEDRGRQVWRASDPTNVTDFAQLVDERLVKNVRVVHPERNGTAALALSGKREYLLFAGSDYFRLPLRRDFSLELWCRTVDNGVPLLSSRPDDYHGAFPFELSVNLYGEAELRCADGKATYRSGRGPLIADGLWHHVAVSYCADSLRYTVFVDGTPADTLYLPESMRMVEAGELLLGTTRARASFAEGEFDELRFWETCRNEQEVDYYKDLTLSGFESALVALYSFDGGSDGVLPAVSQSDSLVAYAYNRPRLVVSTTPLRLETISFAAMSTGEEVLMTWETYDESKVRMYEVEKRTESGRYSVLRQVEPQRLPERHQLYSLSDTWGGKTITYYRLRKITTDGMVLFSAEVPIGTETLLNFTLEDNSPNPFTDSTVIRYTLSKRTRVDLGVYDMMGREVAVLVGERQEAGTHAASFVAGDLPGGVYFYKMRTSAGSQTKKMYLAR